MTENCCNDLAKLSLDELATLKGEVQHLIEQRKAEEIAAYKKTDKFKILKQDFKALKQFAKKLTKTYEFSVLIPLRFKIKVTTNDDLSETIDYNMFSTSPPGDVFDTEISAKASGFDKDTNSFIQGVVNGICEDLCFDTMMKLAPQEAVKSFENFMKSVKKLRNDLDKSSIGATDLQ